MNAITNFTSLIDYLRSCQEKKRVAVIRPRDESTQKAVKLAQDAGFMEPVIVDDAIMGTSGAHPIYFFGKGAIAFNEDTTGIEITETDRDKVGGNDILVTRRAFVMHPRGLAWEGTPSDVTASNAELATAANWSLADNIKNVPITKLVAKLA